MELHLKERTILGKKVKSLRREGLIPGELYGHGAENKHVSIQEKEFEKVYKKAGEHTIVYAITADEERIPAMIVEAKKDPLSQKYLAIDLRQIKMDEEIHTKIPIELTGDAPAAKEGLLVVKVLGELEIRALPKDIPPFIRVEIGGLKHERESIYVRDVAFPKEIKVIVPPDTVIATVTARAKQEEVIPATTEKTNAETPGGEETAKKQ